MRYQDLDAATDLLEVADDADSGYLTLARVGEDRRESQVSSQPLASFTELLDWFHAAVRRTEPGQDGVKLRLRLWGGDRRAIRSVTFRAWDDQEPEQSEPSRAETPSTALTLVPATEPAVPEPAPAPAPRQAPCPACTLLQSHLAAARMRQTPDHIERPWLNIGSARRPEYRWMSWEVDRWWVEVHCGDNSRSELGRKPEPKARDRTASRDGTASGACAGAIPMGKRSGGAFSGRARCGSAGACGSRHARPGRPGAASAPPSARPRSCRPRSKKPAPWVSAGSRTASLATLVRNRISGCS